jgi:Flp pilus assembly protein TadG
MHTRRSATNRNSDRGLDKCREAGQIIVLTALILPVLGGLGGLALDLTYLYGQRQASQMAADAAAQAGAVAQAKGYSTTTVKADAVQYASADGFSSSNSTIQVNVPPLSPPAATTYSNTAVQVVIKVNVNPILAGLAGITGLSSTVQAVASSQIHYVNPGIMWVLDHTAGHALGATGNGCLIVDGNIYVNSNASDAISPGSNGCGGGTSFETTVGGIDVVGGYSSSCCSPIPAHMNTWVPDPLGHMILPYYSGGHWYSGDGTQLSSQSSGSTTLSPGVYTGGISLNGGTTTMSPGIYIMDGGGFSVGGSGFVSGAGVFVYVTNSSTPSNCSGITLAGGGSISFSAPTSGIYSGVMFAQDRSCSAVDHLTGNGALSLDGAFYTPDAQITLSGTAGQSGAAQAEIIADTVFLNGTSNNKLNRPDLSHTPTMTGMQLVE